MPTITMNFAKMTANRLPMKMKAISKHNFST